MWFYEVVPEGEEFHEELDLEDRPYGEVVGEAPCPCFHGSEPAFDTVSIEGLVNPFKGGPQETMAFVHRGACLKSPAPSSGTLYGGCSFARKHIPLERVSTSMQHIHNTILSKP